MRDAERANREQLMMPLVTAAPWIALTMGVVALVVICSMGWRAWRMYSRVHMTSSAAAQLLGVHRDRLDDTLVITNEGSGVLADDAELLAASVAALRSDIDQLGWLLEQIPIERARLRRELLDMLLPTGAARTGDEDADSHA